MSERAAPMYCPYCGEDTIRPWGDDPSNHTDWRCEACLRVFAVRYKGLTGTGLRSRSPVPRIRVVRRSAPELTGSIGR